MYRLETLLSAHPEQKSRSFMMEDSDHTGDHEQLQAEALEFFAAQLRKSGKYRVLPAETRPEQSLDLDNDDHESLPRGGPPTPFPAYMSTPARSTYLAGTPASMNRVPKIPDFSGEGRKGEVEFDVWKYDIKSLMRSFIYPEHVILESIRNSLKGKARTALVHLGEGATPDDILLEMEAIFGNVSTGETLKEQFYSARQEPHETVADFSIRLEHLLSSSNVQLTAAAKNEMLRNRLWSGLRSKELQNAVRYKFETLKSFSLLRKEIRKIEQELKVGTVLSKGADMPLTGEATSLPKEVATSNMTLVESKLLQQMEVLTSQMKTLNDRMDTLEKEVKDLRKEMQDSRERSGGWRERSGGWSRKKWENNTSQNPKQTWDQKPKNTTEKSEEDLNRKGPPQKKGQ